MSTWVYVFDEFKPVDIDTGKLLELAEKDPLKLLEIIKEALADHVKEIKDVKVYDIYFDPSNLDLLIEYLITCELGEVSAKLIHSSKPSETLNKYYVYEKQVKK